MKSTMGRLATVSLVALAATGIAAPAAAKKIDNQYICVFQPGLVAKGNVKAEANRSANAAGGQAKRVYENSIRGFAVNASAQGVSRMQANNPRIAYCEQDQEISISAPPPGKGPGGGGGDGGGGASTQQVPYGIARVNGGVAGNYATAWVIDSGIDLDHPDLNVDAARSRNFSSDKANEDYSGHGTHVAGTIAALDNNFGVIGVAPGAPVVAVKVLNRRGSGAYSDVIAGVDYVAANGANGDVANMSLGGPTSDALDAAVVAAAKTGVKFFIAAGNDRDNANNYSPARVNGTNIWTVSGYDSNDYVYYYSNYGNPPVDWAGPGVQVYSTYKSGGYATLTGTSMATPHIAGLYLLGTPRQDGIVNGDLDNVPDPIAVN